jgi:hypothetical protein
MARRRERDQPALARDDVEDAVAVGTHTRSAAAWHAAAPRALRPVTPLHVNYRHLVSVTSELSDTSGVLELLVAHLSRIKSLTLHALNSFVSFVVTSLNNGSAFQLLEELDLNIDPPRDEFEIQLHLSPAKYPSLSSISLRSARLKPIFTPVGRYETTFGVRSLFLQSGWIDLKDVLQLLAYTNRLRDLHLDATFRPIDNGLAPVTMPRLEVLVFTYDFLQHAHALLCHLITPGLQRLHLYAKTPSGRPSADTSDARQSELVAALIPRFGRCRHLAAYYQRRVSLARMITGAVHLVMTVSDNHRAPQERQNTCSTVAVVLDLLFQATEKHCGVARLLEALDPHILDYRDTGHNQNGPFSELVLRACPSVHTLTLYGVGNGTIGSPNSASLALACLEDQRELGQNIRTILFSEANLSRKTAKQIQSALKHRQLEALHIERSVNVREAHLDAFRTFARQVHWDGRVQCVHIYTLIHVLRWEKKGAVC